MFTRERVEGRIKPIFWFKRTRSHGVHGQIIPQSVSANKFLGCNLCLSFVSMFREVKCCYRLEL